VFFDFGHGVVVNQRADGDAGFHAIADRELSDPID
jgi:hypothetical protein